MRILFHLGHPAHFHLFKNVISRLKGKGVDVDILIKEKDVLSRLLTQSGFKFHNILPKGRSGVGNLGLMKDLIFRGGRLISWCRENKPDLLIGTSLDISYAGKILQIPAVNVNEDDASVVPLYAWFSYPWATEIISPDCCDNGRWNNKTQFYPGYHELAYLHPDLFQPNRQIVSKYYDHKDPYFILRFVKHTAYHDKNGVGLSDELGLKLIDILAPFGQVLISSERPLSPELDQYRVSIEPNDIHHLLAFAKLVIGDSQTIAAEAAVLGTPFIRYNDFVGRIGYLRDLEKKYQLGFGFRIEEKESMIQKVLELASSEDTAEIFQHRKEKMLADKINVADFLFDYIYQENWAT